MTEEQNPDDARKDALRRFKEREAAEALAKADQEAAERDRAKKLQQNRDQWALAFQTIHQGVMASHKAFSNDPNYVYVISMRPEVSVNDAITYKIHPGGHPDNVVANLTFAMDADANGTVRPSADARKCALPAPKQVADVTVEWATSVTDKVMIAVLDAAHP
jgi:hypothetical protein